MKYEHGANVRTDKQGPETIRLSTAPEPPLYSYNGPENITQALY
jgi:hypothetical protein